MNIPATQPIIIETIQWHPASDKPDADTTVLICTPALDEGVGVGFFDGEAWHHSPGGSYVDCEVTHWADVPAGPQPSSINPQP